MSPLAAASGNSTLLADLGTVIAYGLVVGVGLTALFSLAIRGLVTSSGLRREGRSGAALAWAAGGVAALALCLVAVGLGLVTMLDR